MATKNIRSYILGKLFFPKVVRIDRPGVIVNQVSKKYGGLRSRQRILFYFEDTLVKLQKDTIQRIGVTKTNELWYSIGKGFVTRYFLFSNSKKEVPPFLRTSVLDYILSGFRAGGVSAADNLVYNAKKKFIQVSGKNNVISRKSGIHEFIAGAISALSSFLHRENIEAQSYYDDSENVCKIVASPEIEKKYLVDQSKIIPLEKYKKLNFSLPSPRFSRKSSFSDYVSFKKIAVSSFGKFVLHDYTLFPSEIGLMEIMFLRYKEKGLEDLFRSSVSAQAEEVFADLFYNLESFDKKASLLTDVLSALGWGIFYIKENDLGVSVEVKFPPWNRFGYSGYSTFIEGCINALFNKTYDLKSVKENFHNKSLTLSFVMRQKDAS